MTEDVVPLTLRGCAAALAEGTVTSVELTSDLLSRADHIDGAIGAYLRRFDGAALAAAERADRSRSRGRASGPLAGVPVAVKDVLATRECVTTAQSRGFDPGWFAGADASAVMALRRAGAVVLGKTTTLEFTFGWPDGDAGYPVPRNPWDLSRWAGGSSSGSASGVAAGLFPAAIGTDTGGSIRLPSAMCGVTGLKPTFGRVDRYGCLLFAPSMDHVGPIARTAWDCAALLTAMVDGADGAADWCAALDRATSLDGIRVAVLREVPDAVEDSAYVAAQAIAVDVLRDLGVRTVPWTFPDYPRFASAVTTLTLREGADAHPPSRRRAYGRALRAILEHGDEVSECDVVAARRALDEARTHVDDLWRDVDIIAMPVYLGPTRRIEDIERDGLAAGMGTVCCSLWNALGNPAISVPIGRGDGGMPIGLQLVARHGDELTALAVAHAYQSVTSWHEEEPSVLATRG